jgi:aspartyl-tRNA(Asn)/glutamyl-tRNA(Gln) amidotransferase subunit A
MTDHDLALASVADLAPRVRARAVSPVELVGAALARIAADGSRLGAFITVTAEPARAAARAAEAEIGRGVYRGPLHGIPITLKDLFDTAGLRTTVGSRILAERVPTGDATVVERLRAAGAILLGKTNLHEFAFGTTNLNPHFGPARNPHDPDRIPGGSSGGSGVAVAAGMGQASLGTDTGGSIRIPASLCGVVGLKPTYGRVSRAGVFPLAASLDHVGPLTRTVRDAALVLQAIAGPDPRDPTAARWPVPDFSAELEDGARGLRLGLLEDYAADPLAGPAVRAAVQQAARALAEAGAAVEPVRLPIVRQAGPVSTAIMFAEAASVHLRWLRERPDDYGADVRSRLELGALVPAVAYLRAQQARQALGAAVGALLARYDALLGPTTPITAPRSAESRAPEVTRALVAYTRLGNLLGLPALSVPFGRDPAGLPVGVQVIGRPFAEATVLRVGRALELAAP